MTLDEALLLPIPLTIETPRLVLRAVTIEQAQTVFAGVVESVNELAPWMPWVYPSPTLHGSQLFHGNAQSQWFARTMLDFTWFEKHTNTFIGKGGFHTINWAVPKLEIGYWVRTSRAKEGFCTEAVTALTNFARETLHANRLEITSDPRNIASRRVAEKVGFVLEGIMRKNMPDPMLMSVGGLRDSCMYAWVA